MNRKQQIGSLLKRMQFIDLASFVATPPSTREAEIRKYLDRSRGPFPTYEPFRKCTSGIFGVERELDISPKLSREQVAFSIRLACKGKDEAMNLDAASALLDLIASQEAFSAYDFPARSLSLGLDRKCAFRLEHYLVRSSEPVFQFPYPRRTRLSDKQLHVMLSLIHRAYAVDDYSMAKVEIADLSAETDYIYLDGRRSPAPRSPRIVALGDRGPLSKDALEADIQDVYDIMMRLAAE